MCVATRQVRACHLTTLQRSSAPGVTALAQQFLLQCGDDVPPLHNNRKPQHIGVNAITMLQACTTLVLTQQEQRWCMTWSSGINST